MENETYYVYAQTDASGNIITVDSSAFLADTTGWTQIDEGTGDKYHHAQGNYFDKPIMTASGVYRYNLVDGKAVAKTDAEIATEESAQGAPAPSVEERLAASEQAILGLMGVS